MTATKTPTAPPDLDPEKQAILQAIRDLRAARRQLDKDEEAIVAKGRTKGVTWAAMATEFGTTTSWLCQYYGPKLRVSVTVEPIGEEPASWRERPRRGRGRGRAS